MSLVRTNSSEGVVVLSAQQYFDKYARKGIGEGADRWMVKRQLIDAFKKEIFGLVAMRTGRDLNDIPMEEADEVRIKAKNIIHDEVMKWKKLCGMFEMYVQTQNLLKPDDLKLYDEIEDQGITAEEVNEKLNGSDTDGDEVVEDGEEGYAKLLDMINNALLDGKSSEEIAKELDMPTRSVERISLGISVGKMVEAGYSVEEISKSCNISLEEVNQIIFDISPPIVTGYAKPEDSTKEELMYYTESLPEPEDLNLEQETTMVRDDLINGVVSAWDEEGSNG